MAHGDYKCCAVCDSKQEYIGLNDDFKDDICEYCREDTGIATVIQLIQKINSFDSKPKLRAWLKKISLQECWYQNNVDDLIAYKLTGKVPDKYGSPTEWLKDLGAL